MSIIRIAGIKKHSLVDGPGVRFTVFTQGCLHACPGCHNRETWDRDGGLSVDTEDICREMASARFLDGITISGGEPLLQSEAVLEIAQTARAKGLGVWLYTGFTFEQLLAGSAGETALRVLRETDVLVDGRFIQSRAYGERTVDEEGKPFWRGSSNQRLIDAGESCRQGRCVLLSGDAYAYCGAV